MSVWKLPPLIKVYEALGSIADNRINIEDGEAKVFSSSGNKYYTVLYDSSTNSIMCNDNSSYWQGYLGYPAISYLLKIGLIHYSPKTAGLLKNIAWKDINTKFKNDWAKTEKYCLDIIVERGGNIATFQNELNDIYDYLKVHPFNMLGKKIKPPSGY